jgi:hypothetical protein
VSAHALRYYEKAGLMIPVPQHRAGQPVYDEDHVRWVSFLLRLRERDKRWGADLVLRLIWKGEFVDPELLQQPQVARVIRAGTIRCREKFEDFEEKRPLAVGVPVALKLSVRMAAHPELRLDAVEHRWRVRTGAE